MAHNSPYSLHRPTKDDIEKASRRRIENRLADIERTLVKLVTRLEEIENLPIINLLKNGLEDRK